MSPTILVVEDDQKLRNLLSTVLTGEGYEISVVGSGEEAIEALDVSRFTLVLTDVNLPGISGLELLPSILRQQPEAKVIVMTGFASIDVAVQAMKLGAADFLCKPIVIDELLSAVKVAVSSTTAGGDKSFDAPVTDSPIIASSVVMLNLLEQIKIIAPYKINALITGETGTGKELIARAIHQASPRAKEPFVAMNCAAIPEQLLEDELFGHVKGAYTGANSDRKGRFEQADGGTLFMDEIGDMDLALQAKLLRILQENEFERLGSTKTISVDVRVVAATSADLESRIADGTFRADLYHRLNVVHLKLPPLRERPDDVVSLAEGLLGRFCQRTGLPQKQISPEALHLLMRYRFPGNVRQLQNAMERAAVFSGTISVVGAEHLPDEIRSQNDYLASEMNGDLVPLEIPDAGLDFSDVVSQVEKQLLLRTLDKTGGNKMQAARLLNLKRTTLVEKIKRLQIEDDEEEADVASAG